MTTLKLASGDLAIEEGSLVLLSDLADETAQRLASKLRFFYGEWFLAPSAGLPLYEMFLVKNPSLNAVRALIRRTIIEDEGISGIGSIELDFDTPERKLTISFEASLIDGTPLTFTDFILGAV